MKTDLQWLMEVSPVFGKEAQLKNIRRIQADALRSAAEIVRQQDQIIDPRPTAKKLVGLIEAEADKLET